jgi:BCD family chlorophyll transporter-like MFS transporter
MVACFLILVGSSGIEPASKAGRRAKHTADNPLTAFRLLTDNPSARRFFVYLLVVLASFYAQDVVLEPYGAQILGMSVAMTTRLTTVWGTGLLITLIGGLLIVRAIGKKRSANLSAVVAAIAFIFIIVAGIMRDERVFIGAVLLLGLGNGLMTMSNLSFMLDMSIPQAAGLYMGAWGVANFAGRAIATIGSGFLRDSIHQVTGNLLASYVTIFSLEAIGLLTTIWLFRKISVAEFQRDANLHIHEVLALAGD